MSNVYETASLENRLSLLLYTLQDYERIASCLNVSKGLQRFDFSSDSTRDALASIDSDRVAIDVRLMLQRKYFQEKDDLFLKYLIRDAGNAELITESTASRMREKIANVHKQPIELALTDGALTSNQFKNAEDVTYGTLLHGDFEKAQRLEAYPPEMRLLSVAPYVLARENLLYEIRDALIKEGIEPLCGEQGEIVAVLRQDKLTKDNAGINGSPFWANVIGRDVDIHDVTEIANANSIEDNLIILLANEFIDLLCADELDRRALRKMTWKRNWAAWGDFSEATKYIREMGNPGISTQVMHKGGEKYAQVKILPHVIEPWATDVPQLFSSGGCLICFTKRRGKWKVNGMSTLPELQ